jgi:hypothetical protein
MRRLARKGLRREGAENRKKNFFFSTRTSSKSLMARFCERTAG